ncbi:MAG: dihydrodipicolinate synthase family protein [Solibacterales bacterium]|nr:dihydrodipicolinate synthase family protein [Bryobacterales bacterium]|tara:strand:+ start:7343 stop:8413 length:1071 start_codon:yes stop_codon:yes gene_type:complete
MNMPPKPILKHLRQGAVIPAHPLALNSRRKLDEKRQRALTRYYIAAGAGGVAVGVHTTQFGIHDPKIGLLQPVLELAAETLDSYAPKKGAKMIRVAGVVGPTRQAVREAATAAELGYHAGLLNLGGLHKLSPSKLIKHVRLVAEAIPIFGFYLQPAMGGIALPYSFWREFVEIENVVAIKIAAFNRYQTLDVVRAVAESGRAGKIALYTGNDDNIVGDLLTGFRFEQDKRATTVHIVGGLLGHWAFWTRRAVDYWMECRRISVQQKLPVPPRMMTLNTQVTDLNAAAFDAANNFVGAVPGVLEILRRQGLLKGIWCLNRKETLSPGQKAEIDRVCTAYPDLNDTSLVKANLDEWLR